jgi:hypothetical protein
MILESSNIRARVQQCLFSHRRRAFTVNVNVFNISVTSQSHPVPPSSQAHRMDISKFINVINTKFGWINKIYMNDFVFLYEVCVKQFFDKLS